MFTWIDIVSIIYYILAKVPISFTKIKHLNKFLFLKILTVNFEIQLNILLFFIVHFIKLSAAILKRSWFVCLKILPVCLHLFPECERIWIGPWARYTIWSTQGYFITYSKRPNVIKRNPKRGRNESQLFYFPKAAPVNTVSLSTAHFQALTPVYSSLFWTVMFWEVMGVNSGMFLFRNKGQMSLYRQLWKTSDLSRY